MSSLGHPIAGWPLPRTMLGDLKRSSRRISSKPVRPSGRRDEDT